MPVNCLAQWKDRVRFLPPGLPFPPPKVDERVRRSGHSRIIEHCKRPFASVGEMDAKFIANWNARVHPNDTVWHLGDFMLFGAVETVRKYRDCLHGEIHLVRGNHDKRNQDFGSVFASVSDLAEISVGIAGVNHHVVLCHYAMRVWHKSHRGTWHLYGHSHGNLADDPNALSLDVGVDCWDFAPVSPQQVAARMASKTWRPVDHHGSKDEP